MNLHKKVLRLKNNRASVTLEATIVMMIVIYVIVVMIYATYLLYQQVRLQCAVNIAAERGAMVYSNNARDMYTGKINPAEYKNINPFWRIIEGNSTKEGKRQKIEEYVKSDITGTSGRNLLSTKNNVEITAKIEDYIVYKKITVDATGKYVVPVGGFMEWVGLPNPYPISVHAESVVQDSAEMVRNVDLAVDVVVKIDKDKFGGKGSEFFAKMKKGFEKVLGFFKT